MKVTKEEKVSARGRRFSVQRKMTVVARLLRGEPLELVARETNVTIQKLTEWWDRALAGATSALKERERRPRGGFERQVQLLGPLDRTENGSLAYR
jgi:hypothetical protein